MLRAHTLSLVSVLALALAACGQNDAVRLLDNPQQATGLNVTALVIANPTSVTSGASSSLNWSSTNATLCSASGAWTGAVATSGTQSTGPLTASSSTYTLTCTGPGGTGSASATVTVQGPSAPPPPGPSGPTVSVAAIPPDVPSGASSSLVWSSTNVASCTASGAWSGAKAISGVQSTGALTSSSTFRLDCTGPSGGGSASLTLPGSPPPPPPPPPLASTALGTLAASMAPGAWAQLTVSNQDAVLSDIGVSGSMLGYSNSMPWNPFSKVIEIVAGDHLGATPNLHHVRYDVAANQF